MAELRRQLDELLAKGGRELEPLDTRRIVVYGAGGCGRKVARLAQTNGIEVAAFIDARGDNSRNADGILRFAPQSTQVREFAAEGVPVVVGIFNFATDIAPIAQLLNEIGFNRVVSYPEFHEQFGTTDDYWLTRRINYRTRSAEIAETFDLFADQRSREIYYEILVHRLDVDSSRLRTPAVDDHYLPPDLPAPATPMRVIDGGAFDGDTLRLLIGKGLALAAVAAFEPDSQNYRALCTTASELSGKIGEATLVPCGLSERTEMLTFRPGGGSGSSLDERGTTHVQVVALDEILPSFAPTFLKLDIEGAEPAALRGARKLIARHQPRLAVCVYHEPEHLWTLPRLMKELNGSYKLALRYHQRNGFDVVAYAY